MKTATDNSIKIIDEIENSTIIYVKSEWPFQFPKDKEQQEKYFKDARRILDKESHGLNRMGVERLIAALIIEVRNNDYYGKENL